MSDERDYVLKSEAWDGAQASYRKGLAAGRHAGLREAAGMLMAKAAESYAISRRSARPGVVADCEAADRALEEAAEAILALAERGEG